MRQREVPNLALTQRVTFNVYEGVINRFAAFHLNAVTGYTPLMVKARTVAQTFASVHRSTGSLAPGAFVGGGTVLISAQPNLHFGWKPDQPTGSI